MTKGRNRLLLAPLVSAVLILGAPAAALAAPKDDGGRGAHSAQPDEKGDKAEKPDQKPDQKAQDPKAGKEKPPENPPKSGEPKDPKAGEGNAAPKPGDKAGDKAGDGSNAAPKPGGDKKGDAKDGKDGDDDYGRRYDRADGHYDSDRYGYHGRHGWDTHRRYYRYGYRGPGWYDDCGYYGPDRYDSWYDSPDACDWQYGAQGESIRSNMSGDQVMPGPGAPNAFGTANIWVDLANGVLCYRMGYDGINRAAGAHIHRGGQGQTGDPVIDLHPEANGDEGCVGADPTALRNVRDHPEAFYLQLHTPEYPDGALRGQLFPTGTYR